MSISIVDQARRLTQRTWDFLYLLERRRREFGWQSAWVFAKCIVHNRWLRVRSRFSAPRVECPCCGWKGYEFLALDIVRFWGPANVCPQCKGQVRHRALFLYLQRHESRLFQENVRVLHFAPEALFLPLFHSNPKLKYIATDLGPHFLTALRDPKFRSDITRMGVADNSVDFVFCLHVLEHLDDDRKGIAEIHRMLKPGGTAYIMVPFNLELEKSEHYSEPREDMFGHYWWYSPDDFVDKLNDFEVTEVRPGAFWTDEERSRYRIFDREIVHRCIKRGAGTI